METRTERYTVEVPENGSRPPESIDISKIKQEDLFCHELLPKRPKDIEREDSVIDEIKSILDMNNKQDKTRFIINSIISLLAAVAAIIAAVIALVKC